MVTLSVRPQQPPFAKGQGLVPRQRHQPPCLNKILKQPAEARRLCAQREDVHDEDSGKLSVIARRYVLRGVSNQGSPSPFR